MSYSYDFDLIWSSYTGGNSNDEIKNIQSDKAGNIYVIGFTKSTNYPTTKNAYQETNSGDIDIFITKYDKNMNVVWSTYIGGNNREIVHNMAVSDEAIWFVGETLSNDYPTTSNAISRNFSGGSGDIIATKLSLDGEMLYSTYFGGQGYDPAAGMTIDADNNIWVTGRTNSNNFRTTTNSMKSNLDGVYDSYILKISNSGELLYSTLLGSENSDYGLSISYSETDNQVAVSGFTDSKSYPIMGTPLKPEKIGDQNQFDTFISIFNIDGSLNWSSLFGGNGQDYPVTIKYDNQGNLVVHIYTTSDNLVTDKNSYYQNKSGLIDNYLMKLDRDKQIVWSSYFGGNNIDGQDNIFHKYGDLTIDEYDNIYLSAFTRSTDFPTTTDAIFNTLNGSEDCFFAKWSYEGKLLYSSFLGGSNIDGGRSVCVLSDRIVVAGWTDSNDFPTTDDAISRSNLGGRDGFISIFSTQSVCLSAFDSQSGFKDIGLLTNRNVEDDKISITRDNSFDLGYIFYDKNINISQGFETEFSFIISKGKYEANQNFIPNEVMIDSSLPGADGIVLLLLGDYPTFQGRDGGNIGYGGYKNGLAIEIDLYKNTEFLDPNGNHLAIQVVDDGYLTPEHTPARNIFMTQDIPEIVSDSSQQYHCRIEYVNRKLTIYLDSTGEFTNPVAELDDFDFNEYLDMEYYSNAFIGLTSSTGKAVQVHDITHWSLCTYADLAFTTSVEDYQSSFLVYPNPVQDIFYISFDESYASSLDITITDMLGRVVLRDTRYAQNQELEFNVSGLIDGVYNITVATEGELIHSSKIIVK